MPLKKSGSAVKRRPTGSLVPRSGASDVGAPPGYCRGRFSCRRVGGRFRGRLWSRCWGSILLRGRPMGSGCPPSRPRRMILMGGAVWMIRYLVLRSREVMSIWAVNWAFHAEVAPPVHKLVLVALTNFADDEDLAWPHVETLAGMASVSTRTVQRALKALKGAGLIERSMGLAAGARGGCVARIRCID